MGEVTNVVTQTATADEAFERVADYVLSRNKATLCGLVVGVLIGVGNSFLDLDFTVRLSLLGWVVVAIVTVLLLHEGLHGGVGLLLGHRPLFGLEPPLVFTTFKERIPRGHLIAIALAPLVILDAAFVALYAAGVLKLFMALCFTINTIGAVGDVWIVLKVLPHDRGTFIQDTKSGVEVWRPRDSDANGRYAASEETGE